MTNQTTLVNCPECNNIQKLGNKNFYKCQKCNSIVDALLFGKKITMDNFIYNAVINTKGH